MPKYRLIVTLNPWIGEGTGLSYDYRYKIQRKYVFIWINTYTYNTLKAAVEVLTRLQNS